MNTLAAIDPVDQMEAMLLGGPEVEYPTNHFFAPGMYVRQVTLPKDSLIIGHRHKTEHLNFMLKGRMTVWMNGIIQELSAPAMFVSFPGSRKVARIHEEVVFATTHPTDETDVDRLEEMLFEKSPAWLEFHNRKELNE